MMKSLIAFVVVVCGCIGNDAFSQVRTEETRTSVDTVSGESTFTRSVILSHSEDITPRSEMVVINPLKFFLFYNLTYYHILSPHATFGGGFQVPTISGIDGFGVNAEVRLHPSGKAPRGFYVAPNISYNRLSADESESSPFSFGVLLGWQWFPGDEFAMGLGIGVDYYTGSVSNGDEDFGNYDGTAPALRFDIGYAW
jgi:hypothetical protein